MVDKYSFCYSPLFCGDVMEIDHYALCTLCPRSCAINRHKNNGYCSATDELKIGRAALHFWEEPCVSGTRGSGTVFFSGCSLKCCYCQNYNLGRGREGIITNEEKLSKMFLKLQSQGAHNINLVTAEHYAPSVRQAVLSSKEQGLVIPVILNSSGYISLQTIELLKDVIDVYLFDFKYMNEVLAENYSRAKNYPDVAKKALKRITELKPETVIDSEGIIQSGVIVRHLCLPGCAEDSKNVIKYVFDNYKDSIILSIMSQYTPFVKKLRFENLKRKLTESEYDSIIDYCLEIGIEDAYIQDGKAAEESFIPNFDATGVIS